MTNEITVSFKVWAEAENRFQGYILAYKKEPKFVTLQKNEVTLKNWIDSRERVLKFIVNNNKLPLTVRVVIPSTIKTPEPVAKNIIPVLHFNQQNVGKNFGEWCCGPVSSLICASAYDMVSRDDFLTKAYGLIEAMQTKIGSGTTPDNMVAGFNKYFSTLKMEKQEFSELNIKNNVEKKIPMVINLLTNNDFGYNGKFGHYLACTGYDSKVGVNDPHGFSLGRGVRWWYDFPIVRKAVDNNGGRPIFRVVKK